jgi:small subunit ribosomal protein S21
MPVIFNRVKALSPGERPNLIRLGLASKKSHDTRQAPQTPVPASLPAVKELRQNVQVHVRDNNVDQALRALKKKMQREGIFREMKLRRNYEKPSEKRAREQAEAVRRARKMARKRLEREGF